MLDLVQAQQVAARVPKATMEELFSKVQAGEEKEMRLVIKADVQGSLEPIVNSIKKLVITQVLCLRKKIDFSIGLLA